MALAGVFLTILILSLIEKSYPKRIYFEENIKFFEF